MKRDRLEFEQLTVMERWSICNGCGGKGGPVKVPDFVFRGACDRHDFYYWRGGNWMNRLAADTRFLKDMLRAATHQRGWQKPTAVVFAHIYYAAVRLFGRRFFHFGKMRTRQDLKVGRAGRT